MYNFFKNILPRMVLSICTALLLGFMFAVFCSSVLRYGFDAGSVKLEDLIGYTFAALVILSVLVAFYKDRHVRVRMFSSLPNAFDKPYANFLGALPFITIAILSVPAVWFSWSVMEGSLEPEGIGGLFLIKTLLPISFSLVAIFLGLSSKDDRQ